MAKKTAAGLGLSYGWDLGESGPSVKNGMDDNFLMTSVLLNLSALSRTTTLPDSPADGSIYIVPTGETNANSVAVRTGSSWRYFAPKRNWEARVVDESDELVLFNGSEWVTAAMAIAAYSTLNDRVAALELAVDALRT